MFKVSLKSFCVSRPLTTLYGEGGGRGVKETKICDSMVTISHIRVLLTAKYLYGPSDVMQ